MAVRAAFSSAMVCYRPGYRTRLLWRLHQYRGRKGERKAFAWQEYRDLLTAAHRQLPGGMIVCCRPRCLHMVRQR